MSEHYSTWPNGIPPKAWQRVLACDVGGASPWAFEWSAVDPWHNLIFYDEIYKITTDVELLVVECLPKMVNEEGLPYNFLAKVIDYENKIAAEDLRRRGILFTNAQKHGKAGSFQRLNAYLHPNPKHQFPPWHPRAGEFGSPRLFIMSRCKNLIKEFPQQRWKGAKEGLKDEADRSIANHAVDCVLYTVRQLPHPMELKPTNNLVGPAAISLMSRMYWEDCAKAEKKRVPESGRRPYRMGKTPFQLLN